MSELKEKLKARIEAAEHQNPCPEIYLLYTSNEAKEILSLYDKVGQLEKDNKSEKKYCDILIKEKKQLQQQNKRLREALNWYVIRDQRIHEDGREKSRLLRQAEQALKTE